MPIDSIGSPSRIATRTARAAIAVSRTRLWLASGLGCRGRRLSRGEKDLKRRSLPCHTLEGTSAGYAAETLRLKTAKRTNKALRCMKRAIVARLALDSESKRVSKMPRSQCFPLQGYAFRENGPASPLTHYSSRPAICTDPPARTMQPSARSNAAKCLS